MLQNHKKTHSHLPITKHLSNNIQMDELWHLIKQNKTKTEVKLRKSTRKMQNTHNNTIDLAGGLNFLKSTHWKIY